MKSPNTQELTIPIKDLRTSMLQIRQRNGYHIIRRKSFIENFCTEDKKLFQTLTNCITVPKFLIITDNPNVVSTDSRLFGWL